MALVALVVTPVMGVTARLVRMAVVMVWLARRALMVVRAVAVVRVVPGLVVLVAVTVARAAVVARAAAAVTVRMV